MGEIVLVGLCIDEHVGRSIVDGWVVGKRIGAVLYVGGEAEHGFSLVKAKRELVDVGLIGLEVWITLSQFVFGLRLNET